MLEAVQVLLDQSSQIPKPARSLNLQLGSGLISSNPEHQNTSCDEQNIRLLGNNDLKTAQEECGCLQLHGYGLLLGISLQMLDITTKTGERRVDDVGGAV